MGLFRGLCGHAYGLDQPAYMGKRKRDMGKPVEIFVLNKKVRLLQPAQGFRTSLDSVMLAAACPAKDGDRVLDMGCGVGGAAFCLLWRVKDCFVTGIDNEQEYIDLANKNILLNNETERCEFGCKDIRAFTVSGPGQRFDHVICNPPYLDTGSHTRSPDKKRAAALGHEDEDMSVGDWIDAGFDLLKSGGSLTMIHRADMIDRIIHALGRKFGAVEIIPLWPHRDAAAKRIIVRARKDRRTPAALHPGLVLHGANGRYTKEADRILRGGKGLAV
jgi:tRNA1(Val) A37 N6-methylase TrmN6